MNLFISRNLGPNSFITETAVNHGWSLTDIALIQQIPVSIEAELPVSDLIFFTSPTSVTLFLNAFGSPTQPVCTMGKGTSRALPVGVTHAFEGKGTSEEVAKSFATFAQDQTVFFPIGDQSVRTIQKGLRPQQVIELVIYKTLPNPVSLPQQDMYVFTSPSNVRSFLQSNPPPTNKPIVALGQRTADELQKSSIPSLMAKDYSPEGIIDTIFSIVGS